MLFGFDPVGGALGALFMLLALASAIAVILAGGANLLVSYRYRRAEPRRTALRPAHESA